MTKKRTRNLRPLHPATRAALTGEWRVNITDTGEFSATVEAMENPKGKGASYLARDIEPALVELVIRIRSCRGVDSLVELYAESQAKLGRVAGIAVAVDDDAFPEQLAYAMTYARDPASHRRRAILKAHGYLTSGFTSTDHKTGITRRFENPGIEEIHALAEEIHGESIPPKTFGDDLKEMRLDGFRKRPRGRPGNAG
jgi:hypothetical protein